jgi:hypothetical protein
MRLLNVSAPELELKLEEFFGDKIPPYAILSHTWGDGEVTFQDLQRGHYEYKSGFKKIRHTCQQAKRDGLSWCWVDTCCIDKSSSAELSEAINSMFNWYASAQVCYAYLADVNMYVGLECETQQFVGENFAHATDLYDRAIATASNSRPRSICFPQDPATNAAFYDSRWFLRGWTLQELIAPRRLEFFDNSWAPLGERDNELLQFVIERTDLSPEIFGNRRALREIPIARRMSWMANRLTTRKEDEAYCLLGIFEVNMPLLYGEADMAFVRLQEELIRRFRDHSLLIFSGSAPYTGPVREPLASSPQDFAICRNIKVRNSIVFASRSYHLTSDAIHISLPLIRMERSGWRRDLALLNYTPSDTPIAIVLMRVNAEERTWYLARHESLYFQTQDVVRASSLGKGFVTVSEEVAITAKREDILILRDMQLAHAYRDQATDDTWLRYDLALRFEHATPNFVPKHTIERQRKERTPHMIRLTYPSFPQPEFMLNFSLDGIDDIAIAMVVGGRSSSGYFKAVLLVTGTPRMETESELFNRGGDLMFWANHLYGTKDHICLASVPLDGVGKLELWRDGYVGDWKMGQTRLTLRLIQHGIPDNELLSDSTQK